MLPSDGLNRQSASLRLAAKAGHSHTSSGKCKFDRSFETQRRIRADMMKTTSDFVR
jgi:hypothetical protein